MKLRTTLLALALSAPLCLSGAAAFAQGPPPGGPPPREIYERQGPRPYPDGFWIRGHYRWEGGRYVWTGGHWEHRPHPRAVWVAGHWRRGPGGWVWIEGHWS